MAEGQSRGSLRFRRNAYPRWLHSCIKVVEKVIAVIVGAEFQDLETLYRTPKLLAATDRYRDRLLASEISDYVELCNALKMSLEQREAFFRFFCHVDTVRVSSVAQIELLRYCGLRWTPFTAFLLPPSEQGTHRTVEGRYDILQLFTVCFSVCTTPTRMLLDSAISSVCTLPHPCLEGVDGTKHSASSLLRSRLRQQIELCTHFFHGVVHGNIRRLRDALLDLYKDHEKDFCSIHQVQDIHDIVQLFPVLIFPCVWVRRVLCKRVLGKETWRSIGQQRQKLLPLLAPPDRLTAQGIIDASKNATRMKTSSVSIISHVFPGVLNKHYSYVHSGIDETSKDISADTVDSDREHKFEKLCDDLGGDDISSMELPQAWRITGANLLASAYTLSVANADGKEESLRQVFEQMTRDLRHGNLASSFVRKLQRVVIQSYGYHFAIFLLDQVGLPLVPSSEERRTKIRLSKAERGVKLLEDKATFWKQMHDPMTSADFYYNIRTGESRWEKPSTVNKRSKRKRRVNMVQLSTPPATQV